jgi:VWFA-related protein
VACVAIAAFAAILAAPAAAQTPSVRVDIASIDETAYPDARAVLNVEDTSGTQLGPLDASNFAATVNGKPATVKSATLASSEKLGVDVLLMMDTSGSMQGAGLAAAQSAAKSFVAGLAPEDRVAVMRFANSITLQSDYTTDRSATNAAIDGLVAKGQTELYKATSAAAAKARESTSSRRVVILLTDGAQDAIVTDVTDQDAINAAIDSDVPFYTIAQGSQAAGAQFLIDLAARTRGRYLEAPAPGDLAGVYDGIGRLLRNQYFVTIDASAASGVTSGATVAITLNTAGRTATGTTNFVPSAAFARPKINVTVTGLAAGDALSEARTITVAADGAEPIAKAAFYVDDVNVFETAAAPFTFKFDPKDYKGGGHSLRVSVQAGAQSADSLPIAFTSSGPAAAPEATSPSGGGGGGLPIVPIAGGGAVLLALLAGAFVVMTRVRRTSVPTVPAGQRITPWASTHRPISAVPPPEIMPIVEPEAEDIGEPMGLLIIRAGTHLGSEFEVGPKPASIGSASSCAIRIDDMAQEEARVWVRDGHLMYHKKTRLTLIASDGISGGWSILEPGDTFEIGDHRFEFKLLPQGVPDGEAKTDVPNILRERAPLPQPDPRRPEVQQPAPWRTADAPASQIGRIWPGAEGATMPADDADADAEQAS